GWGGSGSGAAGAGALGATMPAPNSLAKLPPPVLRLAFAVALMRGFDLAVGAGCGGDEECGCGRGLRGRRVFSRLQAWLCRRQLAGGGTSVCSGYGHGCGTEQRRGP